MDFEIIISDLGIPIIGISTLGNLELHERQHSLEASNQRSFESSFFLLNPITTIIKTKSII